MSLSMKVVIVAVAGLMACSAAAGERTYVNIDTAGIGGGYYPTGGHICDALNRSRREHGHNIHCTVESTRGSVENLRSIQAGEMDVAIAQSDWQFHSWHGTGRFRGDGRNDKLRFLFSLYADTFHVVVRKSVGAGDLADLKGRVVNIGNAGYGTEATINLALGRYGSMPGDYFGQAARLAPGEQARALCDGRIDAFIFPTGITSASVTQAANACEVSIANWMDPKIMRMASDIPWYCPVTIPADTYRGQSIDVMTWGFLATVVASADADEEAICQLARAVFDNYEDFRKQSPLHVGLTREGSVANGEFAPYHPGAQRYFRQAGLVE